ncbi:protein of unknown function [Legionella fallonii LLAP-10]|uniref:Uncharacterized protein n=1 Tax=Legionella fallonii LLAP-10 TaxID=1212491 RepID=A0A098G3R4_9GAMM|nr:protein of unknown function [Legionella fallonii LLAP-10]
MQGTKESINSLKLVECGRQGVADTKSLIFQRVIFLRFIDNHIIKLYDDLSSGIY